MKRIIIFRFDRKVRICQNRLKLIQKFNPNIPIYGMYGGEDKDFVKYKKALGKYLEFCYCISGKTRRWKWKNFDLALQDWYKQVGKKIDFDMAYVIEWDLILLDSVENLYGHIKEGELGLTNLIQLRKIEKTWSWTTRDPEMSQWAKLYAIAKSKYRYKQKPFASLGPGFCFPKKFLEKYSKLSLPDLVHDELRVPLFAQILGFKFKDTGFSKSWFDREEHKYFNCMGRKHLIDRNLISKEFMKPKGRRAFHPFRDYLKLKS
jgi:hypothetical protein